MYVFLAKFPSICVKISCLRKIYAKTTHLICVNKLRFPPADSRPHLHTPRIPQSQLLRLSVKRSACYSDRSASLCIIFFYLAIVAYFPAKVNRLLQFARKYVSISVENSQVRCNMKRQQQKPEEDKMAKLKRRNWILMFVSLVLAIMAYVFLR